MRTIAVLAMPMLCAGALAACTKSTEQSSTPARNGSCKIALLLPENATPRYEGADKPYFEAEIAAKAPQCKVLYFNAANDGTKQKTQAETAMTQGAQVLVLDAADTKAVASIIEEAKAKGIKTIAYDRTPNGPAAYEFTFNSQQVGQFQGQALVDAMTKAGVPKGSSIVMINGDTGNLEAKKFKAGAHSAIDSSGYKVGAEYDTPLWSPDTATTEMSQAITKLGKTNVKGLYVANDTMAGAAINAMQQAGITPLPPVTGQDAATDGLQRILLGKQTMTIYKPLKKEAAAAADAAIAVATGRPVSTTTSVTNPSGDAIPAELLTPVVVTAANVKSTVVADGFVKVSALCSGDTQPACQKYGIS
ncbi:substrate-binding domain-containing protein [Actinoplanes sp. NPDC051411]|uniref:substrate-binding domain-containing protein n=1 Tax=Actinoplanes sp. NPDC051411 TaxID=3155522 RepID=UPI00341E53F1